jgi:6-phosphofructokinase 1
MRIAILTSGGDSPGMNCAIRSIVRGGIHYGHEVYGIYRGYAGLIAGEISPLKLSDVGNILQRGGTILRSSRCKEFMAAEGRKKAINQLKKFKIDALITIGGDGTFNGAMALHNEFKITIVGIPGTIDNDITGTDYTIGFETAVENAIQAVDKIRDTALSHDRVFLVEVMGKNSPALAERIAVCSGAEMAILPHKDIPYDDIDACIKRGLNRGKRSSIFIVAEGQNSGRGQEIKDTILKRYQIDSHVCILGHIQRGGSPAAVDRFYATQMGLFAVEEIHASQSQSPRAAVVVGGQVQMTDLKNCLQKKIIADELIAKSIAITSI